MSKPRFSRCIDMVVYSWSVINHITTLTMSSSMASHVLVRHSVAIWRISFRFMVTC